jgi:hypothetical protein
MTTPGGNGFDTRLAGRDAVAAGTLVAAAAVVAIGTAPAAVTCDGRGSSPHPTSKARQVNVAVRNIGHPLLLFIDRRRAAVRMKPKFGVD